MSILTKRPISHDEARAAQQRLVNSHFRNPDHARISIPAKPDYDDDLVLAAYIEQQRARDAADEGTRAVPICVCCGKPAIGKCESAASQVTEAPRGKR